MALNKIKNNASWGESASSLNSNFESIEADLTKVKNATTRCKGYFISGDELKTAYPSAHVGDYAYIGTAYPFYIWKWNGSSWGNTGNTGGDQDVNLENYYNKTETDAKLSELGSEVKYSSYQIYLNTLSNQPNGNLFNKDSKGILENKIIYDGDGNITDRDGYNVYEFIAVIPNESYAITNNQYVVFYNLKKEAVVYMYPTDDVVVAPNDGYWARFSYYKNWETDFCFNKGTSILPSEERAFGLVQTENIKDNAVTLEKLSSEVHKGVVLTDEVKSSSYQIYLNSLANQPSGNLFNKDSKGILENKAIFNDKGDITDRDGYNVYEFIAVVPNESYAITNNVSVVCFTLDKKPVAYIAPTNGVINMPENVHWIRFSYYKNWETYFCFNKGTSILPSKERAFGLVQTEKIKDNAVTLEKLSSEVQGKLAETSSAVRKTSSFLIKGSLSQGSILSLPKNSVSVNEYITFSGKINGSFGSLLIGHGKDDYTSAYIKIEADKITAYSMLSSEPTTKIFEHGLTIENNIQVFIDKEKSTTVTIKVSSNGKSYEFGWPSWYGCNGQPFVQSEVGSLTDCSFGWTSRGIISDIWAFGDSYFGVNGTIRWVAYLINEGHDNLLVNAFGGQRSASAYEDLTNLFTIGTPKKILWCLGMNDVDNADSVNANWLSTYNSVKNLCESNNIELILATIPTVPTRINKYKNEIVRNSGYRYIDFDKAVGANETTGEWYGDMLSSDGIHPSETGALALYHQAIADMPELLNC